MQGLQGTAKDPRQRLSEPQARTRSRTGNDDDTTPDILPCRHYLSSRPPTSNAMARCHRVTSGSQALVPPPRFDPGPGPTPNLKRLRCGRAPFNAGVEPRLAFGAWYRVLAR